MFELSLLSPRALVCVLLLASCTAGCTSVRTQSSTNGGTAASGVSYFLPTNHVRVVFTNQTISSVVKAAVKADQAAKKSKEAAETAVKAAEASLAKADPKKPEALAKLKKTVEDAKKALENAKTTSTKADQALKDAKRPRRQILVEVLPAVPDTSKLYVADPWRWGLSDDDVKIETTASGLLEKVSFESDDQTGEIVSTLVETAIEAAKVYGMLYGLPLAGAEQVDRGALRAGLASDPCAPRQIGNSPYYWEFTIDPSNPRDVALVNLKLLETALPYLINLESQPTPFANPPGTGSLIGESGIYYRRPIPYTVEILEDATQKYAACVHVSTQPVSSQLASVAAWVDSHAANIPTSQSKQLLMAAGGPVSILPLTASAFVETKITASFEKGALVEQHVVRPSEVLGFVRIPRDIVVDLSNALASVVSEIFQLKIDTTSKGQELIKAETELLQAQQEKVQLEQAILDQVAATSGPGSDDE